MHELPKDLTNSLRSFRGSIYGSRRTADTDGQEMDLEKGSADVRDREFERALSPTESSPSVVHHVGEPDLEKGEGDIVHPPPLHHLTQPTDITSPTTPKTPKDANKESRSEIYGGPSVKDLDPAAERLARDLTPLSDEDFCTLMGMRPWTTPLDSLHDLAMPQGLYNKIYRAMRYNNRKFKLFDMATYALLLVQLIISAIFIILGALRNIDSHIPIAVLGAVATVLAGTLALMKGQGLPNRLRQTRDGLRTVMFEAEELYWDIRSGRPVLFKDIKKVREDYLRVLQQARAHHPDAWTDEADTIAGGAGRAGARKVGK